MWTPFKGMSGLTIAKSERRCNCLQLFRCTTYNFPPLPNLCLKYPSNGV